MPNPNPTPDTAKRSTLKIALVVALAVGLFNVIVLGAAFLIFDKGSNDTITPVKPQASTSASPEPSPTVIPNTARPSGPVDGHRKKLAQQATDLISQAREVARRPNIDEMLVAIAKGDDSSLPKDFIAKFRFADQLKTDPQLRASAFLGVLQLGKVLNVSIKESHDLELLTGDAWKYVYVDEVAGDAFVPLTLFLGEKAAFSFEYVWVGGQWKFSPYSFIDAVSSADIASQKSSSASALPSESN